MNKGIYVLILEYCFILNFSINRKIKATQSTKISKL